jgi:ubiquinone/menaquinone biosynthesis C-methylase UbiE
MSFDISASPAVAAASAPDPLRARLREMWDGVAPGWEANAAFVDARGAEVTARMLELAAPAPGERVLELACGPGGPGFAAVSLVAPDGDVVVSDVSPAMTGIAGRRAKALGLRAVDARVLDLEQIDEPDEAFDVVLCREGLMLVADPVRAAREIRRVLRPLGRLALSVWGPRAANPWLGLVFDAVGAQLGVPMPPLGVPHPFSLDDRDRLAEVLSAAGLVDVAIAELSTPYRAATTDEWWSRTAVLAGPLARRLAALAPEQATQLRERAEQAASPYLTQEGLVFPGVSLLGSARREDA